MRKFNYNCFKLTALSLALFAFCFVVKGSDDVIKSVELKLLWEKSVDFEYDMIALDADFERFVANKSLGSLRERYIFLNSTCDKVFEIQTSKYGKDPGMLDIDEHPAYLQAKTEGKLNELSLEVDDVIKHSSNCKYIGIIQTYYNNQKQYFSRRFKLFELNPDGQRSIVWKREPICLDVKNVLTGEKVKEPWSFCLDSCSVANNGNVMLWTAKGNHSNRIVISDNTGKILYEETCEPGHYPCFDMFEMNDMGEFYYSKDLGEYGRGGHKDKFFNSQGLEIKETSYHKNDQPFDITKLPFWTSSLTNNILNRQLFKDENGLNVVYVKADHVRGQSITLFNIDRGEEIWTIKNDKDGFEFGKLRTSKNGELILLARIKSWDRSASNFETYQYNSKTNTTEWLFINKAGEIILSHNKIGSLKISADGNKLFCISSNGKLKMFKIIHSR